MASEQDKTEPSIFRLPRGVFDSAWMPRDETEKHIAHLEAENDTLRTENTKLREALRAMQRAYPLNPENYSYAEQEAHWKTKALIPQSEESDACPKCGYTEEDQRIHGDHHLCSGTIPQSEADKIMRRLGCVPIREKKPRSEQEGRANE